jgi:ABC-type sugar transport system permease subunit
MGLAAPPRKSANVRQRRSRLNRTRAGSGVLLATPAFLLVGLVLMLPIGQAVYYSMTNWDGISARWIGPSTYSRLFDNPAFWRVIQNNALLLIAVPITIVASFAVASLLHERIWGWRLWRSMIFMPTVLSWVVIGIVARQAFSDKGVINGALGFLQLGTLRSDYLSGERTALLAIGLTFIWAMIGPNMIILLSGMAAIDPAVYEAARMDGAHRTRVLFSITMPMMRRYFQFCFIFTLIMAFTGLFSLVFVMTGGGPGYGTTTLEFYVYRQAFNSGIFGTAALLGVVLLVILFIISMLQIWATRRDD